MSNTVMHVRRNDTHPLSLSQGPMWDIYVHSSIAACDTTLNYSNNRDVRYVSRNIIFIVGRNTTLEMYILLSHTTYHNHVSDAMQMTCSQTNNEENNHFDNNAQFTTMQS